MSFHTCVWMDHREAIILELKRDSVESSRVRHHGPDQHLHRKADHVGHGSTGLDEGFMAELDNVRNAVRAWALTQGYEVTDRPYENYINGIDTAFTENGEFEVFWTLRDPNAAPAAAAPAAVARPSC